MAGLYQITIDQARFLIVRTPYIEFDSSLSSFGPNSSGQFSRDQI